MKNRRALPLQKPQKPPLSAHERLACSLGEREGAGGEGRRTKKKKDAFPGKKGGAEARVLSLFLPTVHTRMEVLKG